MRISDWSSDVCSSDLIAPETPMYLDGVLADTPLVGGLEPRLGDLHVRTLTILGFPSLSRPGILDALNHQDFGYRWVTRFIALDKTIATRSEEHTSELQSLMRISYAVFCLKKKKNQN